MSIKRSGKLLGIIEDLKKEFFMKTMHRLVFSSLLMVAMLFTSVDMQSFDSDDVVSMLPGYKTYKKTMRALQYGHEAITSPQAQEYAHYTAIALLGAAVLAGSVSLYMNVDSNSTLSAKVDEYLRDIDGCQDLLPPTDYSQSAEIYFEQYLHNKFGIALTDVRLGSDDNYQLVSHRVREMKDRVDAARACVEFRARFFSGLADKMSEIKSLQLSLEKALQDAKHYDKFLLGHQILNFNATLPMNDLAWMSQSSEQQQQSALIKWIRRGYYHDVPYPLTSYTEQISGDIKYIRQYLGKDRTYYSSWYPNLSERLSLCQAALEEASSILIDSPAFKTEKEAQRQEELLQIEQAKVRAQEQAAQAQKAQADALAQQATAQYAQAAAQMNQGWAQHRQAAAQESAQKSSWSKWL